MGIFSGLGTVFTDVICYPLGAILRICYLFTGNYVISLILFTLVIRIALFPLAIKQQKTSAEMLRMKPKMDLIQKKYKKDQAKLQEEMAKLYQEEGYNPLSGCLPMLLQLPILYGLIFVVYSPLTYIMWFSKDTVNKVAEILRPVIKLANPNVKFTDSRIQLYIAKAMNGHMGQLSFLGNVKPIDFNLFGLDLSQIPKFGFEILVLIPILCYLTSMLSSWLTMRMNKGVQPGQMSGGMNSMMMIVLMPLMSAWISLSVPAAVGFYWIITNVFMVFQVMVLQRFFSMDKLAAKSQVKAEQRKQDIRDGKIKPGKMSEIAKRALESQRQTTGQSAAKSDNLSNNSSNGKLPEPKIEDYSENSRSDVIKVNGKGNKSRSQLKEEQRKRLAESRTKDQK
jgi:YidC/Oxa1 family membrane protein insertase